MGALDIVILTSLGISVIVGLSKGLVSQLTSIAAIVVGIWASSSFSLMLFERLSPELSTISPLVLRLICFAVIFIACVVALGLVGKIIDKCLKIIMLGWLNRLLGAVFAVLGCFIILGLIAFIFDAAYCQKAVENGITAMPDFINESRLYWPVLDFSKWLFPQLNLLSI